MGKLLEQYASELRKEMAEKIESLDIKTPDPLDRYKEAKDKDQRFEVTFGMVEPDGSLVGQDEYGVTIRLEGESLARDLSYFASANKAKFMGVDFIVKVLDVDEDTYTVTVRSAWSNSRDTRHRLIAEIMRELENGNENIVLPGRIIMSNEKQALVDILGKGILGIIKVFNWQVGYVRHLKKVAKKNEVYDFVVKKPLKQKPGHSQAFSLSRVEITKDPWTTIPKGIQVGTLINITCVEKPAGKSYWWGICPLVQGIEIMCDYSSSVNRPLVDVVYRCKVTKFDPEKQILQAVPFDVAPGDTGTKEAVKRVTSKRPLPAFVEGTDKTTEVAEEKKTTKKTTTKKADEPKKVAEAKETTEKASEPKKKTTTTTKTAKADAKETPKKKTTAAKGKEQSKAPAKK